MAVTKKKQSRQKASPSKKKNATSNKVRSTSTVADNTIACGDNLELIQQLPDEHCDLIYIDPPFFSNTTRSAAARDKKNKKTPNTYADHWTGGIKTYLAFLQPRLVECHRLLPEAGTLYVHLDYRAAHYVRVLLDTIFGERNFLNEIIWHYRTGGAAKRWFARKHDTILVYAKSNGKHTFHPQRGGTFRTDGLNYDEETGRPYKTTKKGRLYFDPDGPLISDVWDIPFLSTVARERCGWPTQKPLALLERIIAASSNPGDLVADFFSGSGTTLVAAHKQQRRYYGCDASKEAVRLARKRLREAG